MSRRRLSTALVAAIAGLAVAVAAPSGVLAGSGPAADSAGKKRTAKVKVYDDYYSPATMKVKKRTKVKWKWQDTFNPHDVTLRKGPKSLKRKDKKRLNSETRVGDYVFKATLKKKGKYKFYCSIHSTTMKQTIRVK